MRFEVIMRRLRFAAGINGRCNTDCGRSPEVLRFPGGDPVTAGAQVVLKAAVGLFLLLNLALAGPLFAAQDDSKALREQAKIFWEARVKGDWATVYDCLSESERMGVSKEAFVEKNKTGGPFRYLRYKLGEAETADDMGWLKVEYEAEAVRFPGLPARRTERWSYWEKLDGKWYEITGKRVEEIPKLPPSMRPLKEEKAVSARADEFWKAREKGDYAAIYQLCSPAYRQQIPREEFLSKTALNIYVDHQVIWAEVQQNKARVRVAVDFRPNDPHLTKMDPSQQIIFQNWVKVDGQWYLDVNLGEPKSTTNP